MATMQKITPNLWFDRNAEEAATFYVSIFKNSGITRTSHYGKEGQDIHKMPEGTVMTVEFNLDGQKFTGLNAGPIFNFNEAISFIVNCDDQPEIDYYWEKLSAGGDPKAQQCGWLKDKFGVSWQVIPTAIFDMHTDPDPAKRDRVMKAMMQMKKMDLAELKKAFEG
jgi:predicted 3-demethylubiquinone-9 3-methyltransferase (glyoxalase superfamily)